jgi:hypothetical protein
VLGACAASPFYMTKVRLQTQTQAVFLSRERNRLHSTAGSGSASASAAAATESSLAGYQHHYKGLWDALRTVVRTEGFRGLWRGLDGVMPRVVAGSAAQLTSYDVAKRWLVRDLALSPTAFSTHFYASFISGFFVILGMAVHYPVSCGRAASQPCLLCAVCVCFVL